MIARYPVAVLVLCACAFSLWACGSGSSGAKSVTPATTAPSTSVAGTTPAPAGSASSQIRALDLQQSAPVQKLITDTGGQFVASQVIYGDLTGDGIDEAVVPISSGGTMGDIAYVVLTPSSGGVSALPLPKGDTSSGGVAVEIAAGKLVDTRPEYGPDDANCCPSMLRKTTYAWDGKQLTVASAETVPNPGAGVKGTPPAVSITPPPGPAVP